MRTGVELWEGSAGPAGVPDGGGSFGVAVGTPVRIPGWSGAGIVGSGGRAWSARLGAGSVGVEAGLSPFAAVVVVVGRAVVAVVDVVVVGRAVVAVVDVAVVRVVVVVVGAVVLVVGAGAVVLVVGESPASPVLAINRKGPAET